jgi:ferredoxin
VNETAEPTASYTVEFTVSKRTVTCDATQFVLTAALAAGIRLPFTCRQGICGTCKSRLISGLYDMKHKGGIRPHEIEQGFFLPCCSKPLSDLAVEK